MKRPFVLVNMDSPRGRPQGGRETRTWYPFLYVPVACRAIRCIIGVAGSVGDLPGVSGIIR